MTAGGPVNRIDGGPGRHWRGGASPPGVPAPDVGALYKFVDLPELKKSGTMKVWNQKTKKQLTRDEKHVSRSASAPSIASAIRQDTLALRRRDQWNKVQALREQDVLTIQERVERGKEQREERFNRLLEEVTSENPLKASCVETLREFDKDNYRRASAVCDAWHANIFDPVQRQVHKFMNPPNRTLLQSQKGSKSVGFLCPGDKHVAKLAKPDPCKSALTEFAEEEHFRRQADRVLAGDPLVSAADVASKGRAPRFTSKPTLEPVWWDQLRLQSTRYGHFAQVCEAGHGFRTMVRRDDHIPSVSDGVLPAGTRRTRFERNNVGMLRDDVRHRGETFDHFQDYGASSGAPNQDHYLYETGTRVVDGEFPLGKKMWREPPGTVSRDITAHL